MLNYLTPGVYFETVDNSRKAIAALRTDVAAFVGIAARGPLHSPTRVKSWDQFQSLFGGLIPSSYLAYAVKAFFENGGQVLYVVRVASAQARAAETILAGMDGQPTLRVRASSPGSWGNRLAVQVGRSSLAATRALPSRQKVLTETIVESVVGFERGALVRVFHDDLLGPEYRIVIAVDPIRRRLAWDDPLLPVLRPNLPMSFETVEFSLTVLYRGQIQAVYPGLSLCPNHPRYVACAIRQEGDAALIAVEDLAAPVDPEDFCSRPNRQDQNLCAHLPLKSRLPALPKPGSNPVGQPLAGGKDGIASLSPEDFTGSAGDLVRRGLQTLEQVDEVSILAMPDIMIRPVPHIPPQPLPVPQPDHCLLSQPAPPRPGAMVFEVEEDPPSFDQEQIYALQAALIGQCELLKDRLALIDPPSPANPAEVMDFGEIQSWRQRFDSSYAALYFPWLLVYDPLRLGGQIVRAIPPSGHVAGAIANTDLTTGVHRAPANAALQWVQDVQLEVSPEMQGALNPIAVNCIRSFPGRGIRIYGARTLSSNSLLCYVNVRRLLMMIEEAIEESIQWSVFEPNDQILRQTLIMAISNFLTVLWQRGALAGAVAGEAFRVQCDDKNNPPHLADLGQLVVDVSVAPTRPAEFIIIRIGRTEQELEIREIRGA